MPNYPKPIELHKLEKKTHLSKKQIEERENSEIKLGDSVFKKTNHILNNEAALEKWEEVVAIYVDAGIRFVSSSDIGIIERYCITYAEYYELLDLKKEIETKVNDKIKVSAALTKLKIDNNINRKSELLIKMEDRLFLNPLSKIRTVQQEKEQKKNELEENGFNNI